MVVSVAKELTVIPFPEPYADRDSVRAIQEHVGAMACNEIPAFQVDVGSHQDRHLAGTFAVRRIVEDAYQKLVADAYHERGFPPFRFSMQSLRFPYSVPSYYAKRLRLPPHHDNEQIGLAIHKEYFHGSPTVVDFGYLREGAKLPENTYDGHYHGPGLEAFSDVSYTGSTQLGRLSIFSQGDATIGMLPAVHYFQRASEQPGGQHTRYFMLNPHEFDYSRLKNYDDFVETRQQASLHLDWKQWQYIHEQLTSINAKGHEDLTEIARIAASHLQDHPGADMTFWDFREDVSTLAYGVIPKDGSLDSVDVHRIHRHKES